MPYFSLTPLAKMLHTTVIRLGVIGVGAGLAYNNIAVAQGVQSPAVQSSTVHKHYHIPAGTLAQSLNRFASEVGITLSYKPDLVAGKYAPEMTGHVAPHEGLQKILQGSGLEAVHSGDGNYVLRATVSVLPSVQVTANQLGEITEGTGSYTSGSIATATRLVLTPRETPQSISVITQQEMEDFNLTSIDKVIAHTPGVSIVTHDSERNEFHARGFAIENFQYDGVPAWHDTGYSAGHTLSDTAIYDRVEVLKGATGLLTGSGTPGATINLIRKKPTSDFQGKVSVGAGSWDNYRGEVDVSSALNQSGSVRGRAVAVHQDTHSYRDHYQRKVDTLYGILEVDLTSATLLTLGANYQNSDPLGSNWGGSPIFDSNGEFNKVPRSFNNGARWSTWEQYLRTSFATLEHYFDNRWVVKLQLNHQTNGYDAQLAAATTGNPNPLDGSGVRVFGPTSLIGKTTSDSGDLYASGPFQLGGREHELVIGTSIAKREWDSDTYIRPLDYNRDVADYYAWNGDIPFPAFWRHSGKYGDITRENGIYTTARFNVHDDFKLIAGGRIANYKKATLDESGVVVPYLGAVYDLNSIHSLYASYTSIFKPQAARDEQGKTLDPLEGNNYELGWKSAYINGRLNTSLAIFELTQDNFAEASGGFTPEGNLAYRAIQGVETKGYEFDISGQLTPQWNIHTGFSHKVSRYQGEKVSTLSPENQFTLFATYKPGGISSRLTLGGGTRWQDKTWNQVSNPVQGSVQHSVGSYWLLDAMASYRFTENLTVNFTVNNLANEQYYTIFNSYNTYAWGEPRSFNLQASYKF